MNQNTDVRMWTIFGTNEGNVEVCDRHIALQEFPPKSCGRPTVAA